MGAPGALREGGGASTEPPAFDALSEGRAGADYPISVGWPASVQPRQPPSMDATLV